MRRAVGALFVVVWYGLLASGCAGSGAAAPSTSVAALDDRCRALAVRAVEPMADFIDEYGGFSIAHWNALDPAPDFDAVRERVRKRARTAISTGCPSGLFEQAVLDAIDALQGDGPVGDAIAAALKGEEPPPVTATPVVRESTATDVTITPADDLGERLSSVAAGSTIELAAGVYELTDPIVLDVGITIVGAGRDLTTISSKAGGVAIVFLGPGALVMRDLSVEHVGALDASVLLAVKGTIELSGVHVSGGVSSGGAEAGGGGHGLVLAFEQLPGFPDRGSVDPTDTITISDSVISGNAAAGVLVTGDANPVLQRVEVTDNGSCGVCWAGNSSGQLIDALVQRNQIGVQVGELATALVEGTTVSDNRDVGVSVDGAASPVVRASEISNNGQIGVQVTGDAAPVVEASTISGHGVGMLVSGAATPSISGSTLSNHEIGLRVGGAARPTCTGNTITAASTAGITLTDFAGGSVVGNRLRNVPGIGIQVTGSATTLIDRNTVVAPGQAGIQIGDVARPTVTANVVSDSLSIGILVSDDAGGVVTSNMVSGADVAAVMVGGTASPTISANALADNDVGLVYRDSAGGTASDNRITGHTVGVQLVGSAAPTLERNVISGSKEAGVAYGGTAGGEFIGNTLSTNGNISIQVAESAAPTITGNTIEGRAVYAVLLRDDAGGTVSNNTITDHIFGIQIVDRAAPSIVENDFRDIALTSIVYTDSASGEALRNTCQESGLSAGISVTAPADPTLTGNECSITRSS